MHFNLRFAIFAANEDGFVFVFVFACVCLCVLMPKVCCRTRSVTREEKNLTNFLKSPVDKWVENCYEVLKPIISVLHTLIINPGIIMQFDDKVVLLYYMK